MCTSRFVVPVRRLPHLPFLLHARALGVFSGAPDAAQLLAHVEILVAEIGVAYRARRIVRLWEIFVDISNFNSNSSVL